MTSDGIGRQDMAAQVNVGCSSSAEVVFQGLTSAPSIAVVVGPLSPASSSVRLSATQHKLTAPTTKIPASILSMALFLNAAPWHSIAKPLPLHANDDSSKSVAI